MLGEEKMVCLTLVRAGPHLLAVCTQLLAVGSFVASLDDSSQKEVVTWPGPGCNMGAFFKEIQALSFAWLVAISMMLEVLVGRVHWKWLLANILGHGHGSGAG